MNKAEDIDQLMYRELPPDRYCYIHNYIVDLQNQLQQKENIIKEVREYIEYNSYDFGTDSFTNVNDILQILDKEGKDNE